MNGAGQTLLGGLGLALGAQNQRTAAYDSLLAKAAARPATGASDPSSDGFLGQAKKALDIARTAQLINDTHVEDRIRAVEQRREENRLAYFAPGPQDEHGQSTPSAASADMALLLYAGGAAVAKEDVPLVIEAWNRYRNNLPKGHDVDPAVSEAWKRFSLRTFNRDSSEYLREELGFAASMQLATNEAISPWAIGTILRKPVLDDADYDALATYVDYAQNAPTGRTEMLNAASRRLLEQPPSDPYSGWGEVNADAERLAVLHRERWMDPEGFGEARTREMASITRRLNENGHSDTVDDIKMTGRAEGAASAKTKAVMRLSDTPIAEASVGKDVFGISLMDVVDAAEVGPMEWAKTRAKGEKGRNNWAYAMAAVLADPEAMAEFQDRLLAAGYDVDEVAEIRAAAISGDKRRLSPSEVASIKGVLEVGNMGQLGDLMKAWTSRTFDAGLAKSLGERGRAMVGAFTGRAEWENLRDNAEQVSLFDVKRIRREGGK